MCRCLIIASSVLVALVIAGAPAVAQAGVVPVTATQACTLGSDPVPCTYTASDPRVAGEGSHTFVQAWSDDATAVPGTAVALYVTDASIEGPDGTWSGHHLIVVDEDGEAHAMLLLAGAGAYEGLSYVAYGGDPEADANHDLVGVIYEGPLPPVGP